MAAGFSNEKNFDSFLKVEKEGFPDLCRVCMCKNKNMKSVFSPGLSRTVEDLEFCTGILITKEDGLPTLLCDSCFDSLSVAHKFKTACLFADKVFRKILGQQLLNSIKKEKEVLNTSDCQLEVPVITKLEVIEVDEDDDDNNNFDHQNEELIPSLKIGTAKNTNGTTSPQDVNTQTPAALRAVSSQAPTNETESLTKPKAIQKKNVKKASEKMELNVCDICGLKFPRKQLLLKHMWEEHKWRSKVKSKKGLAKKKSIELKPKKTLKEITEPGEKEKNSLCCVMCAVSFRTKELLDKHKWDAHGCECICEVCGKQFLSRSSLYSHVRSHLPPEQECSYCDYKTWHKSDLNKHLRIHTGNKSYVCEYCTNSFYTISNLYEHIRRNHGGRKPHRCPRCDHSFHSSDHLRRHLDSHDNIKRHQCYECHARFTRRCHWKRHLQKQHGVTVPQLKPGRQKSNLVIGDYDMEKERIVKTRSELVAK